MRHRWAGAAAFVCLGPAIAWPAHAEEPSVVWAADTRSSARPGEAPLNPLERTALSRCGPAEDRLGDLAGVLVERRVRGLPIPEAETVAFLERAAGDPHPWPRVFLAVETKSEEATLRGLEAWLGGPPRLGTRRCGVAVRVGRDGHAVLGVVSVDALADLAPLSTRARTGQWLEVEATLGVRSRGGSVVVLGPSGGPRSVPTAFDGTTLRARFALDRPGEFAVQVMADVEGGPRPVLEASVFADTEPPSSPGDEAAPGEEADSVALGDDERLVRLIAGARAAAGVPSLRRDPRLDTLARAHAARMASAHALSHDTGDGDPLDRAGQAGVDAVRIGENVAHATSVLSAHRILWASPSHRSNLVDRRFDRFGVGVARDERGDVWVTESFGGHAVRWPRMVEGGGGRGTE